MTDYIKPQQDVPVGLSLTQFLQTVVVGISMIPGPLVRPKWQPEPPKQPDISVNWIAMGIEVDGRDYNAYVAYKANNEVDFQRNEDLSVSLSIYGPDAIDTYGLLSDGFQIDENRFAMFRNGVGYTDMSPGRRVPDLVNQRWVDRIETTVFLKRKVRRTYSVQTLVSASGTIYVPDVTPDYQLAWQVQ